MQFVCDAPEGKVWFRIETEGEAAAESDAMNHSVEKHFRQARERAAASYKPIFQVSFEQNIGLADHLRRFMPMFLTLRNGDGTALATAMLPASGQPDPSFRPIIVGIGNKDPYPEHGAAIDALGKHYGVSLERGRCFPYGRS
jgi:hypothetical protein